MTDTNSFELWKDEDSREMYPGKNNPNDYGNRDWRLPNSTQLTEQDDQPVQHKRKEDLELGLDASAPAPSSQQPREHVALTLFTKSKGQPWDLDSETKNTGLKGLAKARAALAAAQKNPK